MSSDLALATSSLVNPFIQAPHHLAAGVGLRAQPSHQLAAALALAADCSSGAFGAAPAPKSLMTTTATAGPSGGLLGPATPGGWCLFVYNLAPEVEESILWKLFGPFGAVRQVNLVKDAQTNKCRGFAFVTMADYSQALMAIQALNGFTLANRVLQVSFKTSKVRAGKTVQQQQQQ